MEAPCALPISFQKSLRYDWPHVKLHVSVPGYVPEIIDPQNVSQIRPYIRVQTFLSSTSIPTTNLVKMSVSAKLHDSKMYTAQAFFASAKQLTSLSLYSDSIFKLSAKDERLPQLKQLNMWSKSWPYGLQDDEITSVWDFSQLKDLTIDGRRVCRSMARLGSSDFPALRKLCIFHGPIVSEVDEQDLEQLPPTELFIERLEHLEELDFNVTDLEKSAKAIAKHGKTLKKLHMKRVDTKPYILQPDRTIFFQQIQQACLCLKSLSIDICPVTSSQTNEVGIVPFPQVEKELY